MDRIARIEELKAKIAPLNEKKVLLQIKAQLNQLKAEERIELTRTSEELAALVGELNEKRYRYWVTYRGQLFDYASNSHYWSEPRIEQFYFNTLCEIDAITIDSSSTAGFSSLIDEISNTLYIVRFNQFEILNIKLIRI